MKNKGKRNVIDKYSIYFLVTAVTSVALLLISNITAVKLFQVGSIILPTSALLFPLTYIIGDVIAEVYGYKKAKLVIMLGFTFNAFMSLFFLIAIKLPSAETWTLQNEFASILGTTPRLFIASLTAVLIGSLSNAFVLNVIKKHTGEKLLWVRTIGSTIVGELLDTLAFVLIAFIGTIPTSALITTIISQYIWKVAYEALATPLTYAVINKYKKLENS